MPKANLHPKKVPAAHHHHGSHPEAITRINRASGHLRSIVEMLEAERPCADILQQLSAVISALNGCRVLLLMDHLDSCLKSALKPGDRYLVDEIEEVIRRSLKV